MQNYYIKNEEHKEYLENILAYIKKTAKITHSLYDIKIKEQEVLNAIHSSDKLVMWGVLQKYLKMYAVFVNRFTHITGFYIYQVPSNFYENCTNEDLVLQLKNVYYLIYVEKLVAWSEDKYKDKFCRLISEIKNSSLPPEIIKLFV